MSDAAVYRVKGGKYYLTLAVRLFCGYVDMALVERIVGACAIVNVKNFFTALPVKAVSCGNVLIVLFCVIEVLEIMEEELKENLTDDMEKNEEIFDETMNNPGLWKAIGRKIKKATIAHIPIGNKHLEKVFNLFLFLS